VAEKSQEHDSKSLGDYIPFFVVFLMVGVLSFIIAMPLFRPLAWSSLLAFFSYPLFKYIHTRLFGGKWRNIAAGITTAAVIFMLVLPAVLIGTLLAREGIRLYGQVVELLSELEGKDITSLIDFLPNWLASRGISLEEHLSVLGDVFRQGGRWMASQVASFSRGLLGNAFQLVYQLIVITVATFFFIRDGHVLIEYLGDILPLPKKEREVLFDRATQILQAVIYGLMFTAGIQAVLGGLGWWSVGLTAPVLFGSVMFIFALIPFIGTPMILIPGALYLAAVGQWKSALFLAIWALAVVASIDNFIRPLFISGESKVHLLIVFIGVIGGLAAWGVIGLFYGPLLISLFVFFLDSYRHLWLKFKTEE
jgi:predicted PurR-regulated permease PerM